MSLAILLKGAKRALAPLAFKNMQIHLSILSESTFQFLKSEKVQ